MMLWIYMFLFFLFFFIVKIIINLCLNSKKLTLPPNPSIFPVIGNLLCLGRSFHLEPILRSFHATFGPIITLHFRHCPSIFIADTFLAHQALIEFGAIFADRPPPDATDKFITSNNHTISTAFFGPNWQLLRRNLTSGVLHPSRVKSYAHLRKSVLQFLLKNIHSQAKSDHSVCLTDHFHYAMFSLLAFPCFSDSLDENQIKQIEKAQQLMLFTNSHTKFKKLNFWPRATKILMRKKWQEFFQTLRMHEDALIPHVRTRKILKEENDKERQDSYFVSYVDSLLDLDLPEDKRKLNEAEIVSLCSEFLSSGAETTSTALEWIMANLVKHPQIQEKLFKEIKGIIKDGEKEVNEEELKKLPYLKAVVLEGLRRHPPLHYLIPHAVTEDAELDKYVIPKKGIINFNVALMGCEQGVWDDPMAFKPERFMNNGGGGFDMGGHEHIKMMPFGVGRRMCPGHELAILHLEYFVANLIWNFEWKAGDGEEVDLTEKLGFTVKMKYPLQTHITPRLEKETQTETETGHDMVWDESLLFQTDFERDGTLLYYLSR
ncbi:cytochrome P450 89A2-like [Euphorbia lathyris]|uniref:cytochrome P450 89A2-like n=1 Tax=Euphorbia lathyris TaxID=212925 RepID=UPI0033143012